MFWVGLIAWVIALNMFDAWLDRKFACDCGRSRPWYFNRMHPRGGVFLGRAIVGTVMVVFCIFANYPILGTLIAFVNVFAWRAWWFHEKDKLKKKAAKTAGVVGFNRHGKLVVKPAEV